MKSLTFQDLVSKLDEHNDELLRVIAEQKETIDHLNERIEWA